jgi:hypothetical protein
MNATLVEVTESARDRLELVVNAVQGRRDLEKRRARWSLHHGGVSSARRNVAS